MDEMERKGRFVREELAAMLRAATGGLVAELAYGAHGGRETVTVGYGRDPECREHFEVNVTWDSPWAIAKDVMRAVADWYE